ncbi:dihydrofolate reductase [Actinomycetaceae bacterium L2_0104]
MLGMIWAQGHGRAIGRSGGMAWNVPEDFRFFKRMTLGHPVIMGRRTWESLGARYQPLPNRQNIVVTRNSDFEAGGAEVARSLEEAIARAEPTDPAGLIWIMGGAQIYEAALPLASVLSVTDLDYEVPGADAFAPDFAFSPGNENEWLLRESNPDRGWHTSVSGIDYRFSLYVRAGATVPDSVSLKHAL